MIRVIDFKFIPGFSRFFCDFLSKNNFISERLLFYDEAFKNEEIIHEKLKSYTNRNEVAKLIKKSCANIIFSENQKLHLEILSKDNTLVVVTSLNPYFLGGPLSISYKILTTIFLARKLSEKFPSYNFVPVIWIEDNDHDCIKPFQVTLLNNNFEIVNLPLDGKRLSQWRNSISNYLIFEHLINFLEIHIQTNEYSEKNPPLSKFLMNLYKSETSLTKTFIQILHHLFKDYGLLFLISSDCRAQNSFAQILYKEIENFGASYAIIEQANRLLENKGIVVKSKNSLSNLFFHFEDKRVKLEWNSTKKKFILNEYEIGLSEILNFFERNSEKFSPNVLLRPICQDFILPTIAFVQSSSEIVFFAQLKELYQWHNVVMPAVSPRHSISIIPKRYSNLLNTETFFYFLKPKEHFEEELYNQYRNSSIQSKIQVLEKNIIQNYESLKEIGTYVDRTLNYTAEIHIKNSKEAIDKYINKIYRAEKRKILHENKELITLNTLLYPNDTLQERILASVSALFNFDSNLLKKIEPIFNTNSNKHYLIEL